MPLHATTCNHILSHAITCTCMQLHATICYLMHVHATITTYLDLPGNEKMLGTAKKMHFSLCKPVILCYNPTMLDQ
jgi:hypothetical protein